MRFTILNIILWSRNQSHEPRIVEFEAGVLNVLSGDSQTGKSALIPIVDYCLGSRKCAIPVGVIRKASAWFGVVIQTEQSQILLARREPGVQQSTDEMFIMEALAIKVPRTIPNSNVNRSFIKQYFDSMAGLSSLDMEVDTTNMYKGRPSFRDMAAFNFQPQDIVASPRTLFFKADTTEHREKLKNVMPYALGITTPDVIAKQYELEQLRREEKSGRREFDMLSENTREWITDLRIHLSQAREYGLIPPDTPTDLAERDAIVVLRRVIERSAATSSDDSPPARPALNSIEKELQSLRRREHDYALDLNSLRRRLLEMSKLRDAADAYARALSLEENRLGISRWLLEKSSDAHGECPVCGNELNATHSHLAELLQSLEEVERGSTNFRTLPPTFDKEWVQVQAGIRETTDALNAVQRQIKTLQSSSEAERNRRYTELSASRFVGRIEAGITQYDRLTSNNELKQKLEELVEKIKVLRREVDETVLEGKKRSALAEITKLIDGMLEAFGVENPHDPVALNIKELTLQIERFGRKDYLWEVGSASNWLGYHLGTLLSLHLYFDELPKSVVPSFLMLDQPSQVYFPTKLAGRKTKGELQPDDRVRVRRIFEKLAAVCTEAKGKLQLIVVDHAGQDVWGGIAGINKVADWRGDERLVPKGWLAAEIEEKQDPAS